MLTEEEFFFGSLADLKAVRKTVQIPVLRKDFIIDPWQVWETRAIGADSFLLIVAVLEEGALCDLLELGRSLHMEPLVEVHSREELHRALGVGARIIGVNNRDLRDFHVSLETSIRLVDEIPEECIAVSESGLHSHEDMFRLRDARFRCLSDWRASDEGRGSSSGARRVAWRGRRIVRPLELNVALART